MITSITLQGFKSFAERTRLEFGPGITAVIGPNGSGKSNVVEALRWVSHQARARELRAARATELIFHGSAGASAGGKAPLGLAEVQLELNTHQGERLHLARRIYRDGTAEQDVMGRPARARDVQSSLRGTGLGSGGLAVIGQGEVGSVVQAEGETLLAYVQEAAGLSRSVVARQDTEAHLGTAGAQLAQVRLIEEELGSRVRRLQLSAEAAAQHVVLSLRLLALQDALARARHLAALDELNVLRARATALSSESQAQTVNVQRAAAELEQARAEVVRTREQGQAHAQALELFRAAQRSEAQQRDALGHLERDLEAIRTEQAGLQPEEPALPVPDLDQLHSALARSAGELARATRDARELEAQVRQARERNSRVAQQQAAQTAQHQTLNAEVDLLTRQLAEESAMLDLLRTEAREVKEAAAFQEQGHKKLLASHAVLLDRDRDKRAVEQQLTAELPPLRRELDRLDSSLNSYARYGEGPRTALRSDHPGIVGSVADLLTVPAEHETAVGAALGRRLEQVVVQTADDARDIIDLLKRSGGRATFLPLDLLRPRPRRDGGLLREPGVLGNLSDLCPSDPPIVSQNLLSDTLLLSSLQAATSLARHHSSRPRLVTVEGELIEPGGALTGGRLRDSGAAVLGDQRRFTEVQGELHALETRLAAAAVERTALRAELERSASQEQAARTARDQARGLEREVGLRLARLEARTASLASQQQSLMARLQEAQSADAPRQESAGVSLESLEMKLVELRLTAEQCAVEERRLTAAVNEARGLQTAWAAYRNALQRSERLQTRREQLEQRQADLSAELQLLMAETRRLQGVLGALEPDGLKEAEARREALSLAYSNLIARQNRTAGLLEESRLTLARREGSLVSIPDGVLPAGQPREWQSALTSTQQELEGLGPVNAAAAAELDLEQDRLNRLRRERQDIEDAIVELQEHLGELDRAEQLATRVALERVARAFAEYSRELLGGSGELESQRDEQGRLTGLRLAVQPKGKRTRSLTLLSAGERTMAGLAFLFALGHALGEADTLQVGLPLAVLDEVDAPLDEANIRRFTHFLSLFAQRGSQFLLVTHQKATMEVASALWGVTTDASGASRVLSIRQPDESQARL